MRAPWNPCRFDDQAFRKYRLGRSRDKAVDVLFLDLLLWIKKLALDSDEAATVQCSNQIDAGIGTVAPLTARPVSPELHALKALALDRVRQQPGSD